MVTDTSKPETKFPLSDFEIVVEQKWVPLAEFAEQCGIQVEKMKAIPLDTGWLSVESTDLSYMYATLYLENWRSKKTPSEFASMLTGVSVGDMAVCW